MEQYLINVTRGSYGKLFPYDKSYDRITTKSERPLQLVDRIKYNTTGKPWSVRVLRTARDVPVLVVRVWAMTDKAYNFSSTRSHLRSFLRSHDDLRNLLRPSLRQPT